MNAINEVYYDEHIKSHQRHILVSWLESARSERIRAVKDKVKVHSVKVPVPHEVIEPIYLPEHDEEDKKRFRQRFEGITTEVEVPGAVAFSARTEEEKEAVHRRFEGIKTEVEVPGAVAFSARTEEEKEVVHRRFEGIKTEVEVPGAVAISPQTEEEKQAVKMRFSGITAGISIPEPVKTGTDIVLSGLPDIKIPSGGSGDISDILVCLEADRSRIVRDEAR